MQNLEDELCMNLCYCGYHVCNPKHENNMLLGKDTAYLRRVNHNHAVKEKFRCEKCSFHSSPAHPPTRKSCLSQICHRFHGIPCINKDMLLKIFQAQPQLNFNSNSTQLSVAILSSSLFHFSCHFDLYF